MRKRYDSEREADTRYKQKQAETGYKLTTLRFPPDIVEIVEVQAKPGENFSHTVFRLLRDIDIRTNVR